MYLFQLMGRVESMKPITDKQKHAIKIIENNMGITFSGKTKQDAFIWLQEFVPKLQQTIALQSEISVLKNIDSLTKVGLPTGIEVYEDEITPTMETLDKRIAMDSMLLDRL